VAWRSVGLGFGLSLFLFVARVFADHAHDIFTANNFAAFADAFDGGSDFHFFLLESGAGFGVRIVRRRSLRARTGGGMVTVGAGALAACGESAGCP